MNAAKESVYCERKNKNKCVRTTGDLSKPHSEYINYPSKTEFGKRNNKTYECILVYIYIGIRMKKKTKLFDVKNRHLMYLECFQVFCLCIDSTPTRSL